jgi:hypothetical protein
MITIERLQALRGAYPPGAQVYCKRIDMEGELTSTEGIVRHVFEDGMVGVLQWITFCPIRTRKSKRDKTLQSISPEKTIQEYMLHNPDQLSDTPHLA